MKLRSYQSITVRKLPALLKRHRRVLTVSPTGSGKTVIAAALIRKMKGKRVLWIAHRIELLRQARDQLVASGIPARDIGILSGVETDNEGARILVASVGMLKRHVPKVDLIVVDEAHRVKAKSYLAILAKRPRVPVLGLTATPWRLDGKPLTDVFALTVVAATPTDLIIAKHIAKPVTYGIPLDKARAMLKGVGSSAGDYAQGKLSAAMMRGRLMGDIVSEWLRLANGAATIVFAASRAHARALTRRFLKAGVKAEYLDGDTTEEKRQAMLVRLRDGSTQIVVNVDVLSEGFDCPPVKCIVSARPTQSLSRWLQQTGRASRIFGKRRPVVLDHAGNTWRFGLPESEQSWDSESERQATGDAPVRECPECAHIMPAGCKVCPECGTELPATEQERARLKEEAASLEKLKAAEREMAAAENRIRLVAREKGAPESWVRKVLSVMFEAA